MSDMLDIMKSRRSIKKYKFAPVADELLDKIVEAGLYAANGRGNQNSIIIKVTDKKVRDELSALNCQIGGWKPDFDPFYNAPAVLVVLDKKDSSTCVYDGSLVMGNMMLEAHALGLGSCWIHRAKEEFETEQGKQLLEKLGITEEYVGVGHCIVGYPDGEAPKTPDRKPNRVYSI